MGAPPSLCIFAETCGDAVALEHTGDLYSCDHFVEPKHLLGNIAETPLAALVASPQQRTFGAAKRDTLPLYCRECPVRFACHGECPKNRFILTPDGEPGLNYLCAGYKAFFAHIDRPMRMMADLLRRGRYADGHAGPENEGRARDGRGGPRRAERAMPVWQRPQDQALPRGAHPRRSLERRRKDRTMPTQSDKVQRTILPIPDSQHVGLTTYDAKDPDTKFPPIEPLRPPTARQRAIG